MAIRDRFRRSARKSAGSDDHPLPDAAGAGAAPPTTLINTGINTGVSSLSTSPSSSTAPSTTDLTKMATVSSSTTISSASSSSSSSSSTTTSRRMRLPWGRDKKKSSKNLDSCYGPMNKPFTETNLRHQEMFSTFTMTFGSQRRGSSGAWSYESGVSPFTSRQCSIDLSAGGPSALV